MSIELITITMFGSLFFLLGLGLPVAFACGSVAFCLQPFCRVRPPSTWFPPAYSA